MNKWLKILLTLFIVFVILLLTTIIFRNIILNYTLCRAIEKQSFGKISIDIEKLDLNIFTSSVDLLQTDLFFSNTYLNKNNSIQIDRLSFDSIAIDKMEIRKLLFDKEIDIVKIIVSKPEVYFKEISGRTRSSFQPEKLLELLSKTRSNDLPMKFKINEIEISYGSIQLKGDSVMFGNSELLDFTILLQGFNTDPPKQIKDKQLLFSDNISIKISNLRKFINSGYNLSIDDAIFNSRENRVLFSGISFHPDSVDIATKSRIDFATEHISLSGISLKELSGKEDLTISSIIISDGYFTDYPVRSEKAKTKNIGGINQIFGLLDQFILDTLMIKNVDFKQIGFNKDTLTNIDDIDFSAYDLQLDSNLFDNLSEGLKISELFLETGNCNLQIPGINLGLNTDSLFLDLSSGELHLIGLSLKDISKFDNHKPIDLFVSSLHLQGLNFQDFQSGHKLSLAIKLKDADGRIDFQHPLFKKSKSSNKEFINAEFSNIEVENARLAFSNGNKLELKSDSVYLCISNADEGINFNDLINTDFSVSTGKSVLILENGRFNIISKRFNTNGHSLRIDDIKFKFTAGGKQSYAQIESIELQDIDLTNFKQSRIISSKYFHINNPHLSGDIELNPHGKTMGISRSASGKNSAAFAIELSKIRLSKGNADCAIISDKDTILLKSNFGVTLLDLSYNSSNDFPAFLKNLSGQFDLSQTKIRYHGHQLEMNDLNIDLTSQVVDFDRLAITIEKHSSADINGLVINDLKLGSFYLDGWNLNDILINQNYSLSKLVINELDADISLDRTEHSAERDSTIKKDPSEIINEIIYDSIAFRDIRLKLNTTTNSTYSVIELNGLNIEHSSSTNSGGNMMDDFLFSIKSFTHSDSRITFK